MWFKSQLSLADGTLEYWAMDRQRDHSQKASIIHDANSPHIVRFKATERTVYSAWGITIILGLQT